MGVLGGVDGGGQNVYVAQLAKHLAKRGWAVDVFTRRDSRDAPEVAELVEGVRVVNVPVGPPKFVRKEDMLPFMGEFADWMVSFANRQPERYDLAHANFWMSGQVAADLKRHLGLPFVITFHALGRVRRIYQRDADEFPDARFAVEDRVVDEADAILAECPQDEEDLVALYDADPSRVRIVPCGFDHNEFWPMSKAEARQKLGLDPHEPIVLQLGRMVPRKGVETVIRGVARLVQDHNVPARLLVVGGETREPDTAATPELGRLARIAEDEGIADRVTFTGGRDRQELRLYYNAADAFVTMPWYEPFGITPLEAMACGTPVVGSDVGGVKYTVVNGRTGYLVPPQDDVRLAERLAQLYANPALRRAMGKAAVRRVNDHFTWARVAEQVDAAYTEVLSATPAAPSQDAARTITLAFDASIDAMRRSRTELAEGIMHAAEEMRACFSHGGKVLIAGNGGSAADAQHVAAELVGKFSRPDRAALPALALNADTAILTAWSNDIGYEHAIARQVEAFGQPGDVLLAISTSGRSENLVNAMRTAASRGLTRIALLGGDGGACCPLADVDIVVPSADTPRIQEVHILVLHLIVQLIEDALASSKAIRSTTLTATPDARRANDRARSVPR